MHRADLLDIMRSSRLFWGGGWDTKRALAARLDGNASWTSQSSWREELLCMASVWLLRTHPRGIGLTNYGVDMGDFCTYLTLCMLWEM